MDSNPGKPNKKSPLNDYSRYTSLVFQMIVLVGGGAWLGQFLDERMGNELPWITLVLALLGIIVSIYILLISLRTKK